jgi:class 3 adenylate cyclase
MGAGDWDDSNPFKSIFSIPGADPPKSSNSLADLLGAIGRKPTIPPPPDNNPLANLAVLRALSGYPPPESPFGRISIPPPPPPSKPSPPVGGVSWAQSLVRGLLQRKAAVTPGRVLPSIDHLAIMEGRQVRAAFVYSGLHGFTKLVATQPANKSFIFLHTFVEMATKLTKHYNGEMMDVAGDRVLSVFHRPSTDLSNDPVEDAVTFALQFQTIFQKAIGPAFADLGPLSLGIGVDYGVAVVGCVGIRNNKKIVFFGDAANNAAKLQDIAGEGETVLSAMAQFMRPTYLKDQSWKSTYETLATGTIIFRYKQIFAGSGENPAKPRR